MAHSLSANCTLSAWTPRSYQALFVRRMLIPFVLAQDVWFVWVVLRTATLR